MDRFVRFGLWSGAVGGLLLVAGAGLAWATTGGRPFSAQVVTTTFAVAAVLRLAGVMAMLLGITGLVAGASSRGGRMMYVAYVLCVVDLVIQAGWMFSDLFISETLARRAPDVLDGTAGGRIDQGALLAWVLNLAFVVLAIVLLRTKVYPRTTWIALLAGGALTLVPLPIDGMGYEVLIGLTFAVALVSALRSAGRTDISDPLDSAVTRTTAAVD